MKTLLKLCAVLTVTATLASAQDAYVEPLYDQSPSWSEVIGSATPVLLSFTSDVMLPLFDGTERALKDIIDPALALDADNGIGGGMASAGITLNLSATSLSIKGALLSTALTSTFQNPRKTYGGAIMEVDVPSRDQERVGLGYFQHSESLGTDNDHFLYTYVSMAF